jgi:hypothetical protein
MQAQAAEYSGYAGPFRCFFERRFQRQFVSIEFISNQALKLTRSVCLRAFQPAISSSLLPVADFCGLAWEQEWH